MKTQFELREHSLCVSLGGQLDGSSLGEEFWEGLRDELVEKIADSEASEIFWDLRTLDYADSAGVYYLLELAQDLRTHYATRYVGPGAAIARLEELGQAPHLAPLLPRLPWEEEVQEASDVPLLVLDTAEFSRLVGEGEGVGESEDFVIDLSLEQARLESGGDRRDYAAPTTTLSFGSAATLPQWQPKPPQITGDYAPSPARMLSRDESGIGATSVAPAARPELDASTLEGVGELLKLVGRREQENRELRSRCEELEKRVELSSSPASEAQRRWQELEPTPLNSDELSALNDGWLQLVRSFQNHGRVDPIRVDDFCSRWDSQLRSATSFTLSRWDQHSSPAQRWRALQLFGSTISREDWPPTERRVALTLGVLATLIDLGPGQEGNLGQCRRELEDDLAHLAFGRTYGLAEYYRSDRMSVAMSPEELSALWRGCVALAQEPTWGGDGWSRAFGRAQARFQGEGPVLRGLQRVLAVHSRVVPGSWVELSSGALGIVLGSAPESSTSRVLVLFAPDDSGALNATAPYLFPKAHGEVATILRVLGSTEWKSALSDIETNSTNEETSLPVTEGVSA